MQQTKREQAGAKLLLAKTNGQFPRLQMTFAAGGDERKDLITAITQDYLFDWQGVSKQQKGFNRLTLAVDSRKNSRAC